MNFKTFPLCFCVLFFGIFGLAKNSQAATIWCNPANIGIENGITKEAGYKTLWNAMSQMSSGDTLIVANGDWSLTNGMAIDGNGHLPMSGNSYSSMTTIEAETDWNVYLPQLSDPGIGRSYVKIQGIVFKNESATHGLEGWNHSKIIRCGFYSGLILGNVATFSIGHGHYNLIEECVAWGGGRYKFLDLRGGNNIWRRSVARHDRYDCGTWAGQQSNFRGYGVTNSIWQNCISIDSDRIQYYCGLPNQGENSDYWIGDQENGDGNIIDGCLAIRGFYNPYYLSGPGSPDAAHITLRDSVALGPYAVGQYANTGTLWIANAQVQANHISVYDFSNSPMEFSFSNGKTYSDLALSSSVIRSARSLTLGTADYSYYYDVGSGEWGSHSINADPFTHGWLYPVRVETGSALSTGCNGGRCGAEILKKIGISGTAIDENDYDTLIDENLWPFPNENKIKELMSTTVTGVDGHYGFTTGASLNGSPQTLTKYIWEYLGNEIPCDIYGTCASDSTPPGSPVNLVVR